jgi:hypothetical protein
MRVLKPGLRLKSAVCSTEIMVIRSPGSAALITCGGLEMLAVTETAAADAKLDPAHSAGSLIGKRYVDAAEALELLCTKGGEGSMSVDGAALSIKQAKQLPSSD